MRRWWDIFVDAGKNWNKDNTFKHSAAVSFYTLFSLGPVSIIALTIAGIFFGAEAATAQFNTQMTQLVGKDSAGVFNTVVTANQNQSGGWATKGVGIVLLIVGATTVFGQLQESLNSIWNVRAKPSRNGWVILIMQRVISFAMVVTVGFLLLVSLIVTTALTAMTARFGAGAASHAIDFSVALLVITLLFALIFKVLPDVELRWRDVWIGAFATSVLFSGGRYLIALYLSHSTAASIYGAAGSLVALLIWIYYSCAIMFFGVELTRSYRRALHLPLIPKPSAVVIREAEVEKPNAPLPEKARKARVLKAALKPSPSRPARA